MKRILFLGDSITDCDRLWQPGPDGLGCGYVNILHGMLPGDEYELINRGHNGYTAWQIDRDLDEDCLALRPDIVSLLVGINDIWAYMSGAGGYDGQEFGEIMCRIAGRIRSGTEATVILMGPFLFPWPREYQRWLPVVDDFEAQVGRAAASIHGIFLPLQPLWRSREEPVTSLTIDGIHLTPAGHEILASAWYNCFRQIRNREDDFRFPMRTV